MLRHAFQSNFINREDNAPHLVMVLLQATQLILQVLTLDLQVRPAGCQLIQDLMQAINIGLHVLTEATFRFVPKPQGAQREAPLPGLQHRSFLQGSSIFQAFMGFCEWHLLHAW